MPLPTITRPCACNCGRLVTGSPQVLYTPACKRKKMFAARKAKRAELKSQRGLTRIKPTLTDPPRRKTPLCLTCYGLARERGIDCSCLRAEAAE